ncbi:hypothetical protein [Lewinella sp. LCG006]|uniref:hypothetical protein n=1 Tax=Lewinella sp. LCG006 TaxID=3231911 RepID=UPI003460F720
MAETETAAENKPGEYLLSLAVVIMGTISCYTTAVGVAPMLGNKFFAYFIAVALSLFMIVIALNLPAAETKSRKRGIIAAYAVVALFSILLNFNAIYGISNADTLLYDEINEKRDALVTLSSTAIKDINDKYQVDEWQRQVDDATEQMELEKLTPGEEGCGPKCRAIYRNKLLPAEGKLTAAKREAARHIPKVQNLLSSIYPDQINAIIESDNPRKIDGGIETIIQVYQNIAREIEPITGKTYPTLVYKDRGIGNLSHTVSTIFSFSERNAQGKAAIFISLLISFIIDFLILFVILFLSPKVEIAPKEVYGRRGQSNGSSPKWNRGNKSKKSTTKDRKTASGESEGPFMDRSL